MVLEQPIKYKVCDGVRYTQNPETKILNLLRDIRRSVAILKPLISNHRLDNILEFVERGEWIIEAKVNTKEPLVVLNYNIDLSEAKNLVLQYRQNSEGGCQSCEHLKNHTPLPGERIKYCNEYEDEKLASENWTINTSESPRISKFYKIGCDVKVPILKRKLEEVLEGQN
jgi:hypothetical protein